ncbi:MAG: hypothetical protein A3I09_02470 [Deltaproteobacteria bacterium RIFCSPLOWO2_02_FULL_47_10]|nr:MAG: hypothetical protein A3I09_02470 [Deltaproteobacteria bacterium RIFCSPLOWO2_02_FULL_47_10]
MSRIRICKEENCHNVQTTGGYCRLHYLKNWKKIKQETSTRAAKRLSRYIDSICKEHPKKYLEVIKEDINSDKFKKRDNTTDEVDELYRIFNEPTYEEDIERLIHDLKIEKGF